MSEPTDYAAWGALALLSLLVLAYSVLLLGNVLLGVVVIVLLWLLPLAWKLLRAFLRLVDAAEEIADALGRIAEANEDEN